MEELAAGDRNRYELLPLSNLRGEGSVLYEPSASAQFRFSTEHSLSQRCFMRRRTVFFSIVGEMSRHVLLASHSYGFDSMPYDHDVDVIMSNYSCLGCSNYQLGVSTSFLMR